MAADVKKLAPISEISVDARTLMERLQRCLVGEVVPYAELSAAIGRDVQRSARHLLRTAMHRLKQDEQLVFASVVNVGVKRLNAEEMVGTGERALAHIRSTSRRAAQVQAIVPMGELDDARKSKALFYQSMFGVISHMTRPKTVKAVEAKCEAALPTAKMLEEMAQTL